MARLRHALVAEDTFLEVLAVFKRIIISVIAITVLISLSGCYYYDAGMDNMLTPPKLTEGQNEIYQALQAQVGTGISLKYPRSGEHRSAFVIENIDGEAGKEALVFYQNNINLVSTSSLTVSILDQKDGNWVPAYDIAAAGSDIDQVAFSTFGTQDDKFIIIGYMLTGDKDKVMHIYRYRDGVVQDLFSFSYSLLQVVDIDDNGSPEVIALTPAATGKDGQITNAKANVIRPQGDSFEVTESVDLDSDITSYINVRTGLIDDQKTALYLDGLKGKEQISFVDKKDIIMIERMESATHIVTKDETYRTSIGLGEIEEKLPANDFMRCHKSYIINLAMISKVEPYGRWTYVVHLNGTNQDALITHEKYEELERMFS